MKNIEENFRNAFFVSVLIAIFLLGAIAVSSESVTYNSVRDIPANCTGTITQDTVSGTCRTIVCSSGSDSLQVLACDKPDTGTKQYFEMYKQASSGITPRICLLSTCIQINGYAKSPNYPIIVENASSNSTTPPTNTTNSTSPPSNATCYSNVNSIPANCTGTITQDTKSGCRTLVCSSGAGSIQVLACNKPDIGTKQYFEMNKQASSGIIPTLCIGNTCIKNEGYKKSSNYPICLANSTTNTTTNSTTPPNSTTIIVSSQQAWKDTGINILQGDIIRITASGTIQYDTDGRTSTPNGNEMTDGECSYLVTKPTPAQALVANIAPSSNLDGKGFFVGSNFNGTSHNTTAQSGRLFLGFNDGFVKCDRSGLDSGGVGDNSGSYSATITITHSTTPPSSVPSGCYQNVFQQEARCINSAVTSDQTTGGCREVTCTSSTGTLKVKACDKPSTSFHPYYFEMYKTQTTGYGPNFCLGDTCFQNSGFKRSDNKPACVLTPDARGWEAYLPGWSYSNGIYYASNTNANVPVESYYPEGYSWTNYNVSVFMNVQSGYTPADSQLILRYKNSSNYVACRLMQYSGTHLEIMDPQHNVLNNTAYPYSVGQWIKLEASVNGNTVTCQVAGHPETRLTAIYNLTSSGTVGLRATHIPVQYQNMTVTFN